MRTVTTSVHRWCGVAAATAAVLAVATASAGADPRLPARVVAPSPAGRPVRPPAPAFVPPARPAPAGLPVIDYRPAPRGFPPDPASRSTTPLTRGLHPTTRVVAYDAPGGRPRAYLPRRILGAPVTVPVVGEQWGWTAVLLPSANRRIGWLPPRSGSWVMVELRDQLIVERRAHRLTWLRDGVPVRSWRVTLGSAATPTPLGRTFILGRSRLSGAVYADTDVFALGAVPDDPGAVPAGLRGAHIGIHTWYHDGELGRNTTDGCIRLTRSGHRILLAKVPPGTSVVVVDRLPPSR
jgi:hypothetical protein